MGYISLFQPSTWKNIKYGYEREKALRKFQEDVAAATDYLLENHIQKERIIMKNFAKTAFVWDNDTDYGRQLNRRVEFLIYKSNWRKKK